MTLSFSIIIVVWLILNTWFLVTMIRHYNSLTKNVSGPGMKKVLESIVSTLTSSSKRIDVLEKHVQTLAIDSTQMLQRIGVIRFNPFEDTGGSQSLSIAILDGHENGIVITSLHARTGHRWYVKEVRSGKGKEIELSQEEKAAIKNARRIHS